MKIDKLSLDGKKDSIEILDSIIASKINRKLVSNLLYKTKDNYKIRKINKSEKKKSITSLITEKNNEKNLIIFSDFKNEILKTKEMNKILEKFKAKDSLMILDKSSKNKILRSVKNIPNVKVTDVNHFSSYDVIKFKKIIFTETSMRELEKKYA